MRNPSLSRLATSLAVGMLCVCLMAKKSSGAIIPISEDFDDGVLAGSLEDAGDAFDFSSGHAAYVGDTRTRNYIRTVDSDYNGAGFQYEVSMSLSATGDPWANGFFGIGSGVPGSYFDSPQPAYFLQLEARNQPTELRRFDDAGNRAQLLEWSGLGPLGTGTHRVRMTKSGDEVTWAIDQNYSSTFMADATHVRSFAADTGSMTTTDWHLFFGTGRDSNSSTFDEVAVTPEPAALILLGITCLVVLGLRRPGTAVGLVLIAGVVVGSAARAGPITNGDFEDTSGWSVGDAGTSSFPPGWTADGNRRNAADPQGGGNAIGGTGTSAFLPAHSGGSPQREIEQFFTSKTGPWWDFRMDFAAEDPGGSGSSFRTISGALNQKNGDTINIYFILTRSSPGDADGRGNLMMYDGSAYQHVLTDAVIWDADVQTTPLTHHLTFEGDFDTATGTPDLTASIRDSDGSLHTATGLSQFVLNGSQNPAVTDATDGIDFTSYNTFLSPGDHLMDNLTARTLPEPSAGILVALAGLLVLARRRHGAQHPGSEQR